MPRVDVNRGGMGVQISNVESTLSVAQWVWMAPLITNIIITNIIITSTVITTVTIIITIIIITLLLLLSWLFFLLLLM